MRKIILAILGVLVVAAAVFFGNQLVEKNRKPKPKFKKTNKDSFCRKGSECRYSYYFVSEWKFDGEK